MKVNKRADVAVPFPKGTRPGVTQYNQVLYQMGGEDTEIETWIILDLDINV